MVIEGRASVCESLPNLAVEQTAGSHSLARGCSRQCSVLRSDDNRKSRAGRGGRSDL
jgi:hypothetical protein